MPHDAEIIEFGAGTGAGTDTDAGTGESRDFGADAIGIANGERDGGGAHSGNAISVSMRELSQTTIRSFSRSLPSSIL